jgi:hypothetical protein
MSHAREYLGPFKELRRRMSVARNQVRTGNLQKQDYLRIRDQITSERRMLFRSFSSRAAVAAGGLDVFGSTMQVCKWLNSRSRAFQFCGKEYRYFYHPYNFTLFNERCIEVPIIHSMVKEAFAAGLPVLEIGNVLSHYFPRPKGASHDVVDLYEKDDGVICADAASFSLERKYSLIVSISTLEHVGWDEPVKDSGKPRMALLNIQRHCAPGGEAVVTFGLGQNPHVDALALGGEPEGWQWSFMRKLGAMRWEMCSLEDAKAAKYGEPYTFANCVAFGEWKN